MHSSIVTSSAPVLPGPRDIAEFHAWRRQATWSRRNKLRPLLDLALTPWSVSRAIYRASRAYAPLVADRFHVPRHRQLAQIAWARVRYGLDPTSYYRFQLFRPERWERASEFLQTRDTSLVIRWLVKKTPGYPRVFGDKRAFERWCGEHGLPFVKTLIEFDGGRPTRSIADEGWLPFTDVFVKLANSQAGDGALRWKHVGDGRFLGADGQVRDRAELKAHVAQMSADLGRPILLQRVLRNASSIQCLTTGALCTARLTTMRSPGEGVQMLYAIYRMPVGDSVVDNFDKGGLAAPIDLATGRLGPAVRKHPRFLGSTVSQHPNTGAAIEGHQLPNWAEAVNLALRAHAAVEWKGVPVVGWDVALLEDGPTLLEGNNVPCSTFGQMATGIPAGATAYVACINAHVRERFGKKDSG